MSHITRANNRRYSTRNGRLVYPAGTPLRTVQVVLSDEDYRTACIAGGSRGKAAGGIRLLIQQHGANLRLIAQVRRIKV
jgi:hypothetical protein